MGKIDIFQMEGKRNTPPKMIRSFSVSHQMFKLSNKIRKYYKTPRGVLVLKFELKPIYLQL